MVADHRQVPLTLAVADLFYPDPPQAIEQLDLALRFGGDPLNDARRPCATRHSSAQPSQSWMQFTASHATLILITRSVNREPMTTPTSPPHTITPRRW